MRSSVDFPVPFSPVTATSSPAAICRSAPASTGRRPNRLPTPRAVSTVMVLTSFLLTAFSAAGLAARMVAGENGVGLP
jgi:hypothetical protein